MSGIFKSDEEIKLMRKAGKVSAEVMRRTLGWIHPGLKTSQVDKFIKSQIIGFHMEPAFFGVDGYKYSSCINVNEEMVHALPGKRKLRAGDIVSVDLGAKWKGWNTDMCKTVLVGRDILLKKGKSGKVKKIDNFLSIGKNALNLAIKATVSGNYVGNISYAMQSIVEKAGFNVIRDFVGHGVGKDLHEDPSIPCFGSRGEGLLLEEGMTIAIEVMYARGSPDLVILEDGWTYATKDRSLCAMFEHSIAITEKGPLVLTN